MNSREGMPLSELESVKGARRSAQLRRRSVGSQQPQHPARTTNGPSALEGERQRVGKILGTLTAADRLDPDTAERLVAVLTHPATSPANAVGRFDAARRETARDFGRRIGRTYTQLTGSKT